MLHTKPTHLSDVDDEASFYLARIRQIDKIIEEPVKTLIEVVQWKENTVDSESSPKRQPYFPTWISADLKPENEDNLLTQAICSGTLQRVSRFRRRFSWLDKTTERQLGAVRKELGNAFTPNPPDSFVECAKLLNSKTFGGLNPLTASQVFRVLLDEGEGFAHSGIGFLSFFAMVWPLSRTFPIRLTAGARIEPWDVTAYVTAKCLLPIRKLQEIIERRAKLYDDIAKNLRVLTQNKTGGNPRVRWLFKIELDDLSANLSHLSRYAINRDAFANCARSIQKLSASQDSDDKVYDAVLESLCIALAAIRTNSDQVLTQAKTIVGHMSTMIKEPLRAKQDELEGRDTEQPAAEELQSSECPPSLDFLTEHFGLRFADEYAQNAEYWKDLADAAEKSIDYCSDALKELEAACRICPRAGEKEGMTQRDLEAGITSALTDLANANRKVKDVLNKPVHDAALWCRSIVDREIAHASAENFTDFDPSELVSGIAVAVGWNLMTTRLQVSDAVTKAIAGARKDGSWRSGKPYYSQDHATGIWAITPDIVWTLTSAIKQFPTVNEADHELFNFVDWLERTQISLPVSSTDLSENGAGAQPSEQPSRTYVGWPSERLRDRGKIQLGTTALAINALLEIRDLLEYRLWELCKKRFSVVSIEKPLREIDPVDLGAAHPRRLHRRLEHMEYRARLNRDDAEYSLVLHGPPGSSKTKLAEALSAEMWKFSERWGSSESRLIRITPADFTRLGEDRLDSEARAIFDLISGVRAVTIFFDEIDDLLRQRTFGGERPTFMELVVPAMLNRLADLRSACRRQEICFVLATNYVDNIDSALIRKGRIDASIPVVYPDFLSRVAISTSETRKNLEREQSEKRRTRREEVRELLKPVCKHELIAEKTQGWPYLAFTSLCSFLTRTLIKNPESIFESVLEEGLAEYGSSFSPPPYKERLKSHSQELLNEYIHHIISEDRDARDCERYLNEEVSGLKLDRSTVVKLRDLLAIVLAKEERIPKTGT